MSIKIRQKSENRNPKFRTMWFYNRTKRPKYADGMANGLDPDQTA